MFNQPDLRRIINDFHSFTNNIRNGDPSRSQEIANNSFDSKMAEIQTSLGSLNISQYNDEEGALSYFKRHTSKSYVVEDIGEIAMNVEKKVQLASKIASYVKDLIPTDLSPEVS